VVGRVLAALGMGRRSPSMHHISATAAGSAIRCMRDSSVTSHGNREEGWRVATEVPIGDPAPRGWIDLLAFRPADGSGLVGEMKGDLRDLGELQRQVSFYTRAAAGPPGRWADSSGRRPSWPRSTRA
jgi:hypothetical protein